VKNLITRALSGTVYVALIVGSIYWGQLAFAITFLAISILAFLEFLQMAKYQKIRPEFSVAMVSAFIIYMSIASVSLNYAPSYILVINIPFLSLLAITELFRKKNRPLLNITYSFFALIYIILPLASLSYIYKFNTSIEEGFPSILLGFFILIWVNDTAAYLFGITMGRNKLFEKISPKKTWEGFVGGALICLVVAFLYSVFVSELNYTHWIAIASIVVIFGTLGDLIESMIKRSMKVKDSGNIIPGHGGLLDRIDSILLSAPIVLTYLVAIFELLP